MVAAVVLSFPFLIRAPKTIPTMPNRMLRDWTDSERVNGLTAHAERFFTRLIMKVDDYGCFHADARLLKASLFPLQLDSIREADLSRWMTECQKAGLIVLYESNSKRYLQILDFKQRLDKSNPKFPLPSSGNPLTIVTEFPSEAKAETKTDSETNRESGTIVPERSFKKLNEEEFYKQIARYADGYPKEMLRAFFEYWKEKSATGVMRFQLQKTWDTGLRLKTWQRRDNTFPGSAKDGKGLKPEPPSPTLKTISQ